MRRRYVVTYDVRDPKRLRRTFKVMRNYGDHLQLSVFECLLTRSERILLEEELKKVIHEREDQVLFLDLGSAEGDELPRVTALGARYQPKTVRAVVL